MASSTSTLYSSTSGIFVSSSTLRRCLPIVGAFFMLTLGLSNLFTPLYSSALKTGSVRNWLKALSQKLAACVNRVPVASWLELVAN
ncbi:transmembrane protein, putative [Medicago truncatula]|uniref:Transmembrane protein, putative n=1 Tax=Medicago truncatula TaxID=3880 RepID=A0A072US30_MEDTR|nr:transmembrane protein, putative [Medicago truncatula]